MHNDRSRSSAPARVHRRERASLRIADQDWNTISGFDRQQNLRRVTDERVTEFVVAEHIGFGLRFLLVMNHAHIGAMCLPTASQGPFAVEQLEKPAPVLVNIFGI